jgi:hypothetical protein
MANEQLPTPPPPSSVSAAARPLSAAQLAAELGPKSTPRAEPRGEPPAPKAEPAPKPVDAPAPKEEKAPSSVPSWKDGLKKKLTEPPKEEKTTEAKPEPKEEKAPEPKKTVVSTDDAPPPPKPTSDEVPDDHKKVLPHDKPDTARRIKAILAERDAARQEAAAAKAEYEKAKSAPATPPAELEALRKEHEAAQGELMRLRRLHDIENDKEFAAKYREPVKATEASIESTLKRNGLTDAILDVIKKDGGFANFSRSQRRFTVNEPDPENPGQTKPVSRSASEIARGWLNALPAADAELIRAAVGKQQLLQEEEKAAIAAAQSEAKSYFENQTAAQRQAAEAAEAAKRATLEEYQKWLKGAEEGTEWLKDRPVPDGATAEQKAKIDEENAFNGQLRAMLRKDPTNAKEYGELKLAAAESHHLRRTLGAKDAEIAALKDQLAKAKGAMRTTPRGGSILSKTDAPEKKKEDINPNDVMGTFKSRLRARLQGGQDEE